MMADNPTMINKAVATAMLKNKFSTITKNDAKFAGDFAEFEGYKVLDELNGATVKAERPYTEAEEMSKSLKEFGPSVRFNVQNQEALKGLSFKGEFSEFSSMSDKAVLHWLFELNNTVGRPNGQFGNIVLWNIGKKQDIVIGKLVDYIKGPGNDIAKKFAIYSEQGAEGLAAHIYADASYALRDFSGRINMDLVTAIRNKGGMDNFTIDDLVKLDKPYARPETLMGKEIVPLTGKIILIAGISTVGVNAKSPLNSLDLAFCNQFTTQLDRPLMELTIIVRTHNDDKAAIPHKQEKANRAARNPCHK
jgi:hypothetical protein